MPKKKKDCDVRSDHLASDTQTDSVAPPTGGGQGYGVTQKPIAAPGDHDRGDLQCPDTHAQGVSSAPGEEGRLSYDTQDANAFLPSRVQTITELWRRRQAWHRAEKSLTLQIKAFCRRLCGGDKGEADKLYAVIEKAPFVNTDAHPLAKPAMLSTLPLFTGREPIERERKQVEKQLRHLGEQLPGARYCTDTVGLTPFTLAALIGECPGLNSRGFLDFDTPSRVWKRMGLAVMPDGTRQRRVAGAEALEHGYSPSRRSMVWTFGDSLIKSKGPYRALYDRYKEQERAKAEAKGLTILPAAQISEKRKATGQYISEGIIHLRAKRRMEKAMLADIWAAFRTEAGTKTTSTFTYIEAA